MKKLYPIVSGKLCLVLFFSLLFSSFVHGQIVTYDTTFNGWNAIVTEDLSLRGTDSAAGIVFFPGIGQMTTNINDLLVNGPHYLIKAGLWDGSVPLGNGVHHPFIISLQPPGPDYPASVVKPKIDAILARYRIKRNSFYMTGLSFGGWQANQFVTYQPTIGDHTYGNMVKAIVNLEGVEPADYTGIYAGLPYPQKMGDWAKACGGRELWVEGSQDWRDLLAGAQNMMDAVQGSATYVQVTYGGGAHCCWNTEYNPQVTWTKSSNPNISQLVGQSAAMNVWQWLLRQGDTSMPSPVATPDVSIAPASNAGTGQTITLPASAATLTGTAQANSGASVKMTTWKQVSGPLTTTINTPWALSTEIGGLTEVGSYVYQLTVTGSNNLTSTSTVTVVVNPAPPKTPPAVSAGGDPVITLPVSTVTISGTASGTNGATVKSLVWKETEGPVAAKIASSYSLTTVISGLTVAGSYVFQLTATDNNGLKSSSSVTVVVSPAIVSAKTPPTVSAGANQAITLPTSTVALKGTATGHDGAVVNSYFWNMVSGPSWIKFSNEWALSTAVSGLVAGTYVFRLSASDTYDQTSTSLITVTVDAESSKPVVSEPAASGAVNDKTPPKVSAGKGQKITLPASSTTLEGTAAGTNGAKIAVLSWTQVDGPERARIVSPASLGTEVTGMTKPGDYVYQLIVIDNDGKSSNGSMTVTVEPDGAKAPPTVGAGSNQTITLPTSEVTLKGSAIGQDGAVVNSYFWNLVSGPSWVKFDNEWAPTTTVSWLVAGTYVFELSASDNHDMTSTSTMTVVVKAKSTTSATVGSTAVGVDAMELTDSTAADSAAADQEAGLLLYPNPIHDLLNIRLNNVSTGKVVVMVFNMKGNRIQTMELEKDGYELDASLDVSKLAQGVYVLQIMTGSHIRTTQKFIKQ